MKKFFVTGSAGFIGFHICLSLLQKGYYVFGFDALTDYYDVSLKMDRNKVLKKNKNFTFKQGFLEDKKVLYSCLKKFKPNVVIHLAAQAGVRYSIDNPDSYTQSNILGTHNLLEVIRNCPVDHLLIASTSSVYGNSKRMPYRETSVTDNPMSYYAATKKATEVISHSYSHLFHIPVTCFRFFTVYGPWGRPDMALFSFTKSILEGKPIKVFNNGDMSRDFTYVEDLTEAVKRLCDVIPAQVSNVKKNDIDSLSKTAPWRVVNIGNNSPIKLLAFISELENYLGIKAEKEFLELQPGDVKETFADITLLKKLTGFQPETTIYTGIRKFVDWYKWYYKIGDAR